MRHMDYYWPSILETPGMVIIDDRDPERAVQRTLAFTNPVDVLIANTPDEVPDSLSRMDASLASGKYLAGYLAYDAGIGLDKPIESRHAPSMPLIWLGVYDGYSEIDMGELECGSADDTGNFRLNITEDEYLACIDLIREYIAAGDVYQVNYTVKLLFEHAQPAWSLFTRLRQEHPVGYSAFINTGQAQIVSISPEMFLRREGDRVLTRPMKGTAHRGRWYEEDMEAAINLASDPKNRAENLMILDLMRNDLGRICEVGGVSVPRMFHVERYSTLFQMTSDVEGQLCGNTSTSQLLRAVFPPGSITGAPKIRAMEIIEELEHDSRGVYCGCIGYFQPTGDCLLNVAIRTIIQRGEQCEMGLGSGIVTDSDPQAELAETLLKGRFLQSEHRDNSEHPELVEGVEGQFELLETLLYCPGSGYSLLTEHLTRMRNSSEYFGWRFREEAVKDALHRAAANINAHAKGDARVRLLFNRDGSCRAEWTQVGAPPSTPVKLLLSARRIDPADIFLYHKTTRRQAYDVDLIKARQRGFFDVLYANTRGELTECSVTNIIVEIDGQWYTPPLDCGLLPGIWRARMLGEGKAVERLLTLDDLRRATRVIIGNSVRGAISVASITRDGKNSQSEAIFGTP